jgi:hypothetical protein
VLFLVDLTKSPIQLVVPLRDQEGIVGQENQDFYEILQEFR